MITLPILDVFLAMVVTLAAHPHNPKAFVLSGAKGKATLSYLTLPYNPEQVRTLQPGSDWHVGFSRFDIKMEMMSGNVKIPAATYQLHVRRNDAGEFEQAVFKTQDGKSVVVPIEPFSAPTDEHLTLRVMNNGYVAAGMNSTEPASGNEFTIMMSFGDLHRKFDLKEVIESGQK